MCKVLLVLCCCLVCGGCDMLENSVSNIYGWDLSACIGDFDTCWELFFDNSEKFEGEFVGALDVLIPSGK